MNLIRFSLFIMILGLLLAPPAQGNFIAFDSDFQDKPLGPLMARGPEFWEPSTAPYTPSGMTVVLHQQTQNKRIRIPDNTAGGQAAPFRFLGGQEVTDGQLTIDIHFLFEGFEDYAVQVSGADITNDVFFGVEFEASGQVFRYDSNTPPTLLGNYSAGALQWIELVIDLDAGTYLFRLNGAVRANNETWGPTSSGILELTVGHQEDADAAGAMLVQDLLIVHQPSSTLPKATPSVLLEANFDREPVDRPIDRGGAAVGQPAGIGGAPTVTDNGAFPTPALEHCDRNGGPEFTDFRFLNQALVTEGSISVAFDLFFGSFDTYSVELLADRTLLLGMTFDEDRNVRLRDARSGGTPYFTNPYLERTTFRVRICVLADLELLYVWVNEQLIVRKREPGFGAMDALEFTALDTAGAGSCMYVDNIVVQGLPTTPTTTAAGEAPTLSRAAVLQPPMPNPFNPATSLRFSLANSGQVRLAILDARGRVVTTLIDGPQVAGDHAVHWDGRDALGQSVASGVYHARLEKDGLADFEKLVLVK